jgi:hypothetical protein
MDISGPMNGPVQRSKVFNFRAVQFEPPAKNNATSTPRQAAANPRESYNLETYPKPGKVQGNNP